MALKPAVSLKAVATGTAALPAGAQPFHSDREQETQALETFRHFVEQKILAAPDERKRALRLFVLAMTEAALAAGERKHGLHFRPSFEEKGEFDNDR